jgi:hypothetical protein
MINRAARKLLQCRAWNMAGRDMPITTQPAGRIQEAAVAAAAEQAL